MHEPAGTLGPVGCGSYIGDANQRTQQVEGIEIGADIAAVNGSPHQGIDRPLDQGAGGLEQLGGLFEQRVDCRADELTRCQQH